LLHFTAAEIPVCYLQHYSFNKYDESTWSPQETLEVMLNEICDNMKTILRLNSILPNSFGYSPFGSFQLLVGGSDTKQASKIKSVFSLLNRNENTTTKLWRKNDDTFFLYEKLLNQVVVIKSVMKNLRTKAEATGNSFIEQYSFKKSLISIFFKDVRTGKGLDFPWMDLQYSCITKRARIELCRSSDSRTFYFSEMAIDCNYLNETNLPIWLEISLQ
jgi:hypothetical protein